jgi:hypothetical protein
MQKRYADEVADPIRPPGQDAVDVVRVPPSESTSWGSKTFQLSRRLEYRRLDRAAEHALIETAELDALGAEGWELAGVVQDAGGTHYYLKRVRGS